MRLPRLGALRHQLQGLDNQLAGLFEIPRALDETCHRQIFGDSGLGMAEPLMRQGQT
jgi:hypothetical protein